MRDFCRYFYGVRYYILLRDVFGMCSGCVRDAFGIEPFIERHNFPNTKSVVSPK